MEMKELLQNYYQSMDVNRFFSSLYNLNSLQIMSRKYNLTADDFINTIVQKVVEKNILDKSINDKQFYTICRNIAVDLIRDYGKQSLGKKYKKQQSKLTVAEYINALCVKFNITRKKLAEIVGVNYSTLNRYMKHNCLNKVDKAFFHKKLHTYRSRNTSVCQSKQYYTDKFFTKYNMLKKVEIAQICGISSSSISIKSAHGMSEDFYFKYDKIMQEKAAYVLKFFSIIGDKLERWQIANILRITERKLSKLIIDMDEKEFMRVMLIINEYL